MSSVGPQARFPMDESLLALVLRPYKDNCRYLQRVEVEHPRLEEFPEVGDWSHGQITAHGSFAIPESCYIEDTGHFNAVEFNICINQLTYAVTAYAIEHRLLSLFDYLDRDGFRRNQLANMVIIDYHSTFRKPIAADDFQGRVKIIKMYKRMNIIFMKTECAFHGRNDGMAKGEILFAALNPGPGQP